jgi:hypothetical protein
MVKIIQLLILLCISVTSEAQWRNYPWQIIETSDFARYLEWTDASFSSRGQSIEEPYFSHVVVDQIVFKIDAVGAWVFIQQGMFGDSPYRKRIYITSQLNDTTIVSKSFQLNNADLYNINDTSIVYKLNYITLDSLHYMQGCDSHIHMGADSVFYGSLAEGKCDGTYAGATHTTSEFRVYENMIVSWERGWRGTEQRWGSSRGFYYFRRVKNPSYNLR